MGGGEGYAPPVSTGLNEITVNVYVTFELK
jgi:hypothetical protein